MRQGVYSVVAVVAVVGIVDWWSLGPMHAALVAYLVGMARGALLVEAA